MSFYLQNYVGYCALNMFVFPGTFSQPENRENTGCSNKIYPFLFQTRLKVTYWC